MGDEVTFRTSVGGYRRDEVLEYVESTNEKIFQMEKSQTEEVKKYRSQIQELEELLQKEREERSKIAGEQEQKIQDLEKENSRLSQDLKQMEEKWKDAYQDYVRTESEKNILKDKLAREILRLRAENNTLGEKLREAENNIGSKADYEAVRRSVSEVQYKIAEYVNAINKTQESLSETYQSMNAIKKKLSAKIAEEAKK